MCGKCGNGLVDADQNEQCDPGEPKEDRCCHPGTCRWVADGESNPKSNCGTPSECHIFVCDGSGGCKSVEATDGTKCGICASCRGGYCVYDQTRHQDCGVCKKCVAIGSCENQEEGEDLKNECHEAFANASSFCKAGECHLFECLSGWENCDNDIGNGCETDLNRKESCGSCDRTCQHGICENYSCRCDQGYWGESCDRDCKQTAPIPPSLLSPHNGARTGGWIVSGSLQPLFRWRWQEDGCGRPTFTIQIDDSCPRSRFSDCDFSSPEVQAEIPENRSFQPAVPLAVSTNPPVGRRYFWRVRVCREGGCSPWSKVWYLDVGQAAQDFNGDGFSDVAVGAHAWDSQVHQNTGQVYVYLSLKDDIFNPESIIVHPNSEQLAWFGYSLVTGDVNGDGYDDLLVGAPYKDYQAADEGVVYLFYGSSSGLTLSEVVLQNPEDRPYTTFGWAVASGGDINGDGYQDVVVGAPNYFFENSWAGGAFVFLGSEQGPQFAALLRNPQLQNDAFFGGSVALASDVNADGYSDVLVGAKNQNNGTNKEGNAFLYLGGSAAVNQIPDLILDNPDDYPDRQTNANFAHSLAPGDINGDGFSDVIIGAPNQNNGASEEGNAFVYFGSEAGLSGRPDVTLDNPGNPPNGQPRAHFGCSVAIADVNGDRFSDVVVGAMDQSNPETNEGNAFVYHGSANGLPAQPSTVLDNPQNQAGGKFGYAVACGGDANGDGFDDIVCGAPRQDHSYEDEGMVFLFLGSTEGAKTNPDILANPNFQASCFFGWALSNAGKGN